MSMWIFPSRSVPSAVSLGEPARAAGAERAFETKPISHDDMTTLRSDSDVRPCLLGERGERFGP
jgi:hypothetical protein